MSSTLLPSNESVLIQSRDIVYRGAIPNHIEVLNFDPMNCEVKLLPYLAQTVQVLYWGDGMSIEEKRELVKNSRLLHRHTGTPYAIHEVFKILNMEATIKEWFNYGYEPHHFRVNVDIYTRGISQELLSTLEEMIQRYKNVREQLDTIEITLATKLNATIGMALSGGESVTLYPWQLDKISFRACPINMGMSTQSAEIVTLYPHQEEI